MVACLKNTVYIEWKYKKKIKNVWHFAESVKCSPLPLIRYPRLPLICWSRGFINLIVYLA